MQITHTMTDSADNAISEKSNSSQLTVYQPKVAYFCMEYGIDQSLRLYAGGLGILAGDYIKAAGNLKLPMVAIGLMYQ
jgi:starch phosphorylase